MINEKGTEFRVRWVYSPLAAVAAIGIIYRLYFIA